MYAVVDFLQKGTKEGISYKYKKYFKCFCKANGIGIICLVSTSPINTKISGIVTKELVNRPLYKVDMDLRMGRGYIPKESSLVRKPITLVDEDSLKFSTIVSVYRVRNM